MSKSKSISFDMVDKAMRGVLAKIESHLREASMSATQFGYLSIGDPALVRDLKRGRVLRAATVRKIQEYIEENER